MMIYTESVLLAPRNTTRRRNAKLSSSTWPTYPYATNAARAPHVLFISFRQTNLPSRVASVNAKIATRHEAAGIAEEEDGGAAELLGAADAAEHVLTCPLGLALGVVVEEVLEHLGQNITGGEGVDSDSVLAPFGSQAATQLDDGGLGWIVYPGLC